MINRDTFSSYHPLVNFLYFALVLVFGMCFMHPVCLVISLGSATAYNLYLKGRKGLLFSLRFLLPMMFLGRVGPLTLALALSSRISRVRPVSKYPEEKIMIG